MSTKIVFTIAFKENYAVTQLKLLLDTLLSYQILS